MTSAKTFRGRCLTDGPRSLGVHGWVGASGKGKLAWQLRVKARHIVGRVDGFYVDPLSRVPNQFFRVFSFELFFGKFGPFWINGL